jgi:hypothetical protein
MSEEHYLPAALGDFGAFQVLDGRVCAECNNAIGQTAETQFLRAGPIALFRWILGVEGRNGRPPDPFYRAAGGAPPLLTYGRPPGFDYDVLCEVEWATRNVGFARQIVFHDPARGRVPILVTDRMLTDAGQLPLALGIAGIPHARPLLAWAREDEIPAVDCLLRVHYGALPPTLWGNADVPPGNGIDIRTVVQVGAPFFRAAAKVLFHYSLKVFPDLDGAAPAYSPLRRFIRDGEGDGFVTEMRQQVVENFRRGYRPTQWCHILLVERNYTRIFGYVQFFVSPESLPFPLRVDIGPNPSRIVQRPERRAHMFLMETVAGGGTPHGTVVDLNPAELLRVPT